MGDLLRRRPCRHLPFSRSCVAPTPSATEPSAPTSPRPTRRRADRNGSAAAGSATARRARRTRTTAAAAGLRGPQPARASSAPHLPNARSYLPPATARRPRAARRRRRAARSDLSDDGAAAVGAARRRPLRPFSRVEERAPRPLRWRSSRRRRRAEGRRRARRRRRRRRGAASQHLHHEVVVENAAAPRRRAEGGGASSSKSRREGSTAGGGARRRARVALPAAGGGGGLRGGGDGHHGRRGGARPVDLAGAGVSGLLRTQRVERQHAALAAERHKRRRCCSGRRRSGGRPRRGRGRGLGVGESGVEPGGGLRIESVQVAGEAAPAAAGAWPDAAEEVTRGHPAMLRRRCRRRRRRCGARERRRLRAAATTDRWRAANPSSDCRPSPSPSARARAAAAAGCGARLGRRRVLDLIVDEETFLHQTGGDGRRPLAGDKGRVGGERQFELANAQDEGLVAARMLELECPPSSVRSCLSVAHVRSVKTSSFERPSSAKIRLGRESAPDDGSEACSAPTPTFDVGAAARIVSQPLITAGGGMSESSSRRRNPPAVSAVTRRVTRRVIAAASAAERADSASDVSFPALLAEEQPQRAGCVAVAVAHAAQRGERPAVDDVAAAPPLEPRRLEVEDEHVLLAQPEAAAAGEALAHRHREHVHEVERPLAQRRRAQLALLEDAAHPEDAVVLEPLRGLRQARPRVVHELERRLRLLEGLRSGWYLRLCAGTPSSSPRPPRQI